MNFEIKEEYSSKIDSLSNKSDSQRSQFIWITKDGGFSTDLLNIYFSIDCIPDKKWLINTKPNIDIEEFWREIAFHLHNEFEEFQDLSSLKVTKMIDANSNMNIPLFGEVNKYLQDNSEVICEVESWDIWINLYLQVWNRFLLNTDS